MHSQCRWLQYIPESKSCGELVTLNLILLYSCVYLSFVCKQYGEVLDLIRDNILATDLSHHLRIVSHLETMAEGGMSMCIYLDGIFGWNIPCLSVVRYDHSNSDHRHLMLCLLMTSSDLCACTKTWHAAKAVAVSYIICCCSCKNHMLLLSQDLIYAEFFSQGDLVSLHFME